MKTKRMLLNLATDLLPMIVISLLGLIKIKLFITVLGTDVQGLYQFFSKVMFYVSIVDGGLGSAVLYALYGPNTKNNNEEMNEILSGASRVFSLMGMIVYGLAFIVSFFIPFFIKDNPFDYGYVIVTFLLFAISSGVSYFFVPYQSLLEVKEKRYIYNTFFQLGQIIQSALEIIMLLYGLDLLFILFMHSIVKLVSYLLVMIWSKRLFPEYNFHNTKKDYAFVHQVKHLMFHKINGLIGSNIDILIITRFIGLSAVSIYSTYSYIVEMIKQIIEKIYSSSLAIIGNSIKRDQAHAFQLFKEMNSLMFYIGTVVCVPLVMAIDYFIDIWYEGEILTDTKIAFGFIGILFLAIIKIAITVFVNAGGLFQETKFCALTDTIVNLILSLTLVNWFGISGVLFATCVSVFIAEYIMKTIVIHHKIFYQSSIPYFRHNIILFSILIMDMIVGYRLLPLFRINSLISWFLYFSAYTLINAAIILAIYIMTKDAPFMKRVLRLIKKGN